MSGGVPKPGKEFEQRVSDAYRRLGAKVKHDVELAGNQIDVYVEMESADRGLHRIAVEVKDWKKPVGIDVINDFTRVVDVLRNKANLIDEGVIVSASGFSRQARNAAQTHKIRLLEPNDLIAGPPVPIDEIRILGSDDGEPPNETLRLQISVNVEFPKFSEGHQDALLNWLASLAHISRDEIIVREVMPGSTKLVVEIPIKAAERLMRLYQLGPSAMTPVPERYATPIGDVTGPAHEGRGDIVIYSGGPQPPTTHAVELDLEFANRETELRILMKPVENPGAPRYIQVHAPSGMGKTYLLRKASSEYEAAKWLCAWLDFSTDTRLGHNAMRILEQLGGQFGRSGERVRTSAELAQLVVRPRKQNVIFLDAVDLASGEVRRWIKMDLIPNLEDRIHDPKLRPCFIAAGRRPIREWAVYSKQRFESVSLTPFTDTVVDEFLRRLTRAAGYDLPDDFFQSMTGAILSVTKGHPACIKLVLHEIRSREFTMTAHDVIQADTFNRTVGALLDHEILALQVSEKLREVFKTLCVLRGYTPSLLVRLAEDGWIPAREHIDWDLERELQATYLVEIPDSNPLYRIEPLIRQLVALQMACNDEDSFLGLNQTAVNIFEEQVMGQTRDGNELPDKPPDRMQVGLAVEALYHHLVLLRHKGIDEHQARDKLLNRIEEYIFFRRTQQNDKFWADLLLGALERDTELTALMYELTGEGGLEFVFQPLYALSGTEEV